MKRQKPRGVRINATRKTKWHLVDKSAADKLTQATSARGTVFQLGLSDLPRQLQPVRGAVSYFVSALAEPHRLDSVTVGGEILLARTDGGTTKNYQFAFATSSDGTVRFSGPHKTFAGHHVTESSAVALSNLFGRTPYSKKHE